MTSSLSRVSHAPASSVDPGVARSLVDRLVRVVPDFPRPGILFRDLTPLLADPDGLAVCVRALAAGLTDRLGPVPSGARRLVAGMEARGFMVGAPVAMALGRGFVALRKPGKLPPPTLSRSYELEYGEASLELNPATVAAGDEVVIVDDLLATGGTAAAAARLVEAAGARVAGFAFLMELADLHGRDVLGDAPVVCLATY